MQQDPFDINDETIAFADEGELIGSIVEIQEELERIGANKLLAELDKTRSELKDLMMSRLKDYAVDETTGRYAEIQVRTKTVYDVDKFKDLLGGKAERYIIEQVDADAVKKGLKNGDISLTTLEQVTEKVPTSAALYIKKVKEEAE